MKTKGFLTADTEQRSTSQTPEGKPLYRVQPEQGYYRLGSHFFHVHATGITHTNIDLVNLIDHISLTQDDKLQPVSKDIFEQEVRNVVLNTGIYKYVKSL